MKTIMLAGGSAIAIAAIATVHIMSALASDRDPSSTWQPGAKTTSKQPTGYEIRGCAHYDLKGTKVHEVCNERSERNYFDRQEKANPSGGGN